MAGKIPQSFIDDLVNRIDIVEFIDQRVPLKKTGVNFSACCPFHDEKTPSFSVSPNKQIYYCFGCGVGGNVISFIMAYERIEFLDALHNLAAQAGMELPQGNQHYSQQHGHKDGYELLAQAAHFYQQQLRHHPQAQQAIDYLKNRGLSGQIAKHFGIGFAPPGWDNLIKALSQVKDSQKLLTTAGMLIQKDNGKCYDRFRHRIMFPIRDRRGRVIAFGGRVLGDDTPKYLNSPETPLFHKGKELYGLYEARQAERDLKYVMIVEGYMDVVALVQHGITAVVATLGTAATRDHIQSLSRFTPEIIFCFDGDSAGQTAAWRALENCLPALQGGTQARFMFLAQGEDPDSLVRKVGKDGFIQQMRQALPLSDFLFQHLSEDIDMASIDGKARLMNLAMPLIKQVPEGSFHQLLLQRLSQITRLDSQHLNAGHAQTSPARHPNEPTENPAPHAAANVRPGLPPLLQLATILLLQNPQLAESIEDPSAIQALEVPGIEFFLQILKYIQEHPAATTAQILEHWRDNEHHAFITQLATQQHSVPSSGLKEEFIDTLERCAELDQERRVETLISKANLKGLDDQEKRLLQSLLTRT